MTTTKNATSGTRVVLTLTLADGTTITHQAAKLPRCWKSVLMQLAPYGTDFCGATFARTHA